MENKKMFDTNERELLLKEENTIESRKYLNKLEEVRKFKESLLQKQSAAVQEKKEIKNQIALLNTEYLKEEDPVKAAEIKNKKLELRLKLDDLEDLTNTKITNIIQEKHLKTLNDYEASARSENVRFQAEVEARRRYYLELKEQIQNKLSEVNLVAKSHPYNFIDSKTEEIKQLDYKYDGGWVDSVKVSARSNTTAVSKDGEVHVLGVSNTPHSYL